MAGVEKDPYMEVTADVNGNTDVTVAVLTQAIAAEAAQEQATSNA